MATRTKRVQQVNRPDGEEAAVVVGDQLEALARQGARQRLMEALEEEVEANLQRGRYERPLADGMNAPRKMRRAARSNQRRRSSAAIATVRRRAG